MKRKAAKEKQSSDGSFLSGLKSTKKEYGNFAGAHSRRPGFFSLNFLEFHPNDPLSRLYLGRALEYEEQPPDVGWNAVEVFKKK
jgi:hypothetical protein